MVKKKFVTARIGEDFVSDNIDPYVGEEKSFPSRAKLIQWAIKAVKPLFERPDLCKGKPPVIRIQLGDQFDASPRKEIIMVYGTPLEQQP